MDNQTWFDATLVYILITAMNSKVGEFFQLTISAHLLTFFSSVILLRIFYLSAKRLSKFADGGDVKLVSLVYSDLQCHIKFKRA